MKSISSSTASANLAEPNRSWLDAIEAAPFYGTSPKTLLRLAREGSIPCLRLGRKIVRFRLSDIEAAAAKEVSS